MKKNQRVKPGRKFDQVCRGAKGVFFRDGYSGASVDDIAKAAHVSKATLYSYFPEKSMMYHEVIRIELEGMPRQAPIAIDDDLPMPQALPLMTRQIAGWLSSRPVAQLHRLCIAEAARFPELTAAFRRTLDSVLRDVARDHLDRWSAQGDLHIPDSTLAAEQLIRLSGAVLQDRALFGEAAGSDATAIARIGDSAARLFLIAHRPSDAGHATLVAVC